MKKFLLLLLVSAMAFSCQEKVEPLPEGTPLTLSATEVTLSVGSAQGLTVSAPAQYVGNENLVWVSTNPTVASVDATGKVTALSMGQTVITAFVDGQQRVRGACKVTVDGSSVQIKMATYSTSGTPKTKLALSRDTMIVMYEILPALTADQTVTLARSDAQAAVVKTSAPTVILDANDQPTNKGSFIVVGNTVGQVKLTLVNAANQVTGSVTVEVVNTTGYVAEKGIATGDDAVLTQLTMDDEKLISIVGLPADGKFAPFTFKSSNEGVVQVTPYNKDDAKTSKVIFTGAIVTPVGKGDVTVVATNADGQTLSWDIKVVDGAGKTSELAFASNKATIAIGGGINAPKATAADANAKITYSLEYPAADKKPASGGFYGQGLIAFDPASGGNPTQGMAWFIASSENAKGEPVADTVFITVAGVSNTSAMTGDAIYTFKPAYKMDGLGPKLVFTANLTNWMSMPVTLTGAQLYIKKGTPVAGGAKDEVLTADKVLQTITGQSVAIAQSASGALVFDAVKVAAVELPGTMVEYTFTRDGATFTAKYAVVLDNGVAWTAKK